MRGLLRRFLLGHGPLKRTSDRLHALSRVILLASMVGAVPIAVAIGAAQSAALHETAARQAAERHLTTATLLADAPATGRNTAEGPADGQVLALATWAGRDGSRHRGQLWAPAGAPIGTAVRVWIDACGEVTSRPLPSADITAEVVVFASFIALSLPSGVAILHFFAVWAIDVARDRRWAAEWASVEPQWAGRSS
jgi:hypothetical protein